MTQKEVAEKLGREQSYIARVERGKADIQLSSFLRIATVLGIQFIPTFAQVVMLAAEPFGRLAGMMTEHIGKWLQYYFILEELIVPMLAIFLCIA